MRNVTERIIGGKLFGKDGGTGALAQALAKVPLPVKAGETAAEVVPGAPVLEMSEQERQELAATEPAVEQGNPYDRLFEGVVFSAAEGGQIYTRDGDGQKSKKIGNFLAQVRGVAVSIPGTIYARLPKGRPNPYVDVTFIGTQRANALKPHDEESRAHLVAWKVRTAHQFADWLKSQKSSNATAQSVTMPTIDGISFAEGEQA